MPPKKVKAQEYDERMKQASQVLSMISEDSTTPRNIRRVAKEALDALNVGGQSQGVKAAQAISLLDEISQDTNMPAYTRTRIWNVVSILEVIKE
ncbi:MAG: uncharacterized protein QG670_163 [Thermoproteota archaeon]|nr:uncharacterized protein [Thermoproteota archaeon]